MQLAVYCFVKHAVIDRMNKQLLTVTVGKVMFSRNNCMQHVCGVFGLDDGVDGAMICPTLLLMDKENMCLCFYGGILPP